ncbi:hypothetical protein [Hymenobacter sp. B81]|uniref:hypothetical protein n=1 Tax=Hymenobacter sp. B81 TaxID=3344878 RepID=UPI0037DCB33D
MTPSTDNTPEQRSTGSLEDLFRQKLAEAEVTPRADVWDRLDHELLLRQNEGYRRRLGAWRWVAAAACLVATFSGGAWLTQQGRFGAAADSPLAAASTVRATLGDDSAAAQAKPGVASQRPQGSEATMATSQRAGGQVSEPVPARSSEPQIASVAQPGDEIPVAERFRRAAAGVVEANDQAPTAFAGVERSAAGSSRSRSVAASTRSAIGEGGATMSAAARGARSYASLTGYRSAGSTALEVNAEQTAREVAHLQFIATQLPHGAWSPRPDSLKAALLQAPMLALGTTVSETAAEEEKPNAAAARKWQWRTQYAASRFDPNVSALTAAASSAVSFDAMSRSNSYTSKKRPELAAGLAHRGQLGGSWQFADRWSLLTGVEMRSASGNTVVEENPASLYGPGTPMVAYKAPEQRLATYNFTSAGMPLQVRYASRKSGWSLYAAVGAAVNVLLRNRLQMDGQEVLDEVTYNRLLASARGDMGVQYASAKAPWKIMVGPEAEAGLNTLNANASGNWTERTRPYSIGLAASIEFGARKPDAVQP